MSAHPPHRGQSPFFPDPGIASFISGKKRALTPFLFLIFAAPVLGDAYSDARGELFAAYQAQDFAAMERAAVRALDARPGYPGARFNLAYAKALRGDAEGALSVLRELAGQGIDFGAADIEDFAGLQALPGWQPYRETIEELHQPVGEATVAARYPLADFVPEGIAVIDGDIVLGSIRHGSIVRLGDKTKVLGSAEAGGHWSVFGMRAGPDGGLWFGSAAVPEFAAADESSAGSTGIFRLDLSSGKITAQAMLPMQEQPMVLGDLVFVDDNTLYASESLVGALYRYSLDSRELEQVVAPGVMRSMQGLVQDASGKYLYVADYVGGLFRVKLDDFTVERVTGDASTNLFGIDGLYRHGRRLIAIQNGIRPNCVVALTLADDGLSIVDSEILARNLPEFDEPTLGTVVGDEFLFVANSHWNRFDRDGNLPYGLEGPIILRISL